MSEIYDKLLSSENVRQLISHLSSMELNQVDSDRRTPFYLACRAHKTKVIRALLEEPGVDINFPAMDNWTPFYNICNLGFTEIVKLLIAHPNLDLITPTAKGFFPLWTILESRKLEVLELLLAIRGRSFGIHPNTWEMAYTTPKASLIQLANAIPDQVATLFSSFVQAPESVRNSLRQKLYSEGKRIGINEADPRDFDELWMDLYFASQKNEKKRVGWVLNCGMGFNLNPATKIQYGHQIFDLNSEFLSMMSSFNNNANKSNSAPTQAAPVKNDHLEATQKLLNEALEKNSKLEAELSQTKTQLIETQNQLKNEKLNRNDAETKLAEMRSDLTLFQEQFFKITLKNKELQNLANDVQEINARLQQQLLDQPNQFTSSSQSSQPSRPVQIFTYQPPTFVDSSSSCIVFPAAEVEKATSGFSLQNKIGEGGCGQVFKGRLAQIPVAVKRLTLNSDEALQTIKSEINSLSKYRHPYLVTLIGHTDLTQPNPSLIYPLMPQGSLRDRLDCRDGSSPLTWDVRLKIMWQTACALVFLHHPYPSSPILLHLDIKSDNILLDQEYGVKVSDFGLVKMIDKEKVIKDQPLFGTPGYLCPEFLKNGTISEKTDVFAFGVVMLEVLTGKTAVQTHSSGQTQNLTKIFMNNMKTAGSLMNPAFLDPHINNSWPRDNYQTFAQLSRECIEPVSAKRPVMAEVADRLKLLVEQKHRVCSVCMDNPTNARLQCGHAVLCGPCADYLKRRGEGCPICRAPIVSVQNGLFSKTFIP